MVYPIILFPATETTFDTNGLGQLGEATSCVVTEEGNGSFELEMNYPVTGRRFKDLQTRAIIVTKPNPIDPPQAFRIYEYSKPMNGIVTFYASHISYDLSGYPVRPFTANSCQEAMSSIESNSVVSTPFTFWTDKATSGTLRLEVPMSIRSLLGGTEGSILDIYKGEYKFDNFQIRLYENRGADRGVVIRYGKNLLSVKQEENCSSVYTHVLPYWSGDVDGIQEVVMLPEITLPTKGTYDYTRILVLDLSSDFQERPFVVDLRARANEYISSSDLGVPSVNFDVSFTQLEQTEEYKDYALLERVELFDTVTVEFPKFNISATAKVTKTVFNCLTGKYDSVSLGSIKSTMSDTVAQQASDIENVPAKVESQLQKGVNEATQWITNGRGYMVAVKNEVGQWMEICSLDTPDLSQAINVWRWNQGGFGHSSHGYNGPYDVAITQDGKIVANFVTAGTMLCDRIRGGELILGGINNDYGHIRVIGGNTEIESVNKAITDIDNLGIMADYISINKSLDLTYDSSQIKVAKGYAVIQDDQNGDGGALMFRSGPVDFSFYTMLTIRNGWAYPLAQYGDGEIIDSFSGAVFLTGGYGIYIDKARIGNTQYTALTTNYASRLQYPYEMSSTMSGDVGSGSTDENGECLVSFDDVYTEVSALDIEYYVFLQKEGEGDLWVDNKGSNYFIVKGSPNLKFSWEVKAKKKGSENERLDNASIFEDRQLDYESSYIEEIQTAFKDVEEIYDDIQIDEIKILVKQREEAY